MTQTVTKTVLILARYELKNTGTVIYSVRNGENREYCIGLHKSGNTTCTCKHGEFAGNKAHCYHVTECQKAEAARALLPTEALHDLAMALDTTVGTLPKREVKRTCLSCQREYTCWASPSEPDGFCSEKCEKALDELYSQPSEPQMNEMAAYYEKEKAIAELDWQRANANGVEVIALFTGKEQGLAESARCTWEMQNDSRFV